MYALSVKYPWSWAIIHSDKRIENRTWKRDSIIGQRIAIHESTRLDKDGLEELLEHGFEPVPNLGCIIGTAVVTGFIEASESPWFVDGSIGWVLDDVVPCEPIPAKGSLGLWLTDQRLKRRLR